VSRAQRAPHTALCNRGRDSAGTSIRVWGSHTLSASALGHEGSARSQTSTAPHERSPPTRGPMSAPRASLPLDNREPQKGSAQALEGTTALRPFQPLTAAPNTPAQRPPSMTSLVCQPVSSSIAIAMPAPVA
jgi:hypothetical protein